MRFIKNEFLPLAKAIDTVISIIREEYSVDQKQFDSIKQVLADFCSPLQKKISVFIEHPYVDKVYRDSYYNYFSTKYKEYQRDCIRLSFFTGEVKEPDILEQCRQDFLEANFFGYCVIRPTFPDIIGRNLMSKKAFIENNFVTCIHREDVLIRSVKLKVEGFPHSSQDEENITCAETTVWALMEYFGHKYAEYKPVLPSTIIKKLDEYSDKRMLPSNGLTPEQISFTLKDFGFGTLIHTKRDDTKTEFLTRLSIYTESGIPFIATIENKSIAHAVLIVGHERVCTDDMLQAFKNTRKKIIPFTSIVKKYIVQDDNQPPYSRIPLNNPVINYDPKSDFANGKITAAVIPLYRKMYMDVQKAQAFFKEIFNDPSYGMVTSRKHIFRMYMASSRSFKEHIGQQPIDLTLKKVLLSVAMPRFIWCGEYINADDAVTRTVSSLIILDATETGENWKDSFIFAAHQKESKFYIAIDHTYKLIRLHKLFKGFLMFDHNLN